MEKEIYAILKEQYEYCKTLYPLENIIGIYAYGQIHYNINATLDDLKTELVYIPSFKEIYTSTNIIYENIVYNNRTISIRDLRYAYNAVQNGDAFFIHSLYTPYYVVNYKYEDYFNKYFRNKADSIFAGSKFPRVRACAKNMLNIIQEVKNGNLDNLYMIRHWLEAGTRYLDNKDFWYCIQPQSEEERKWYSAARQAPEIILRDNKNYLSEMEKAAYNLLYACDKAQVLKASIPAFDLDEAISVFFKSHLNRTYPFVQFMKEVNDIEKSAIITLASVLEVGEEKLISFNKLSRDSGISRVIFTNLLSKLEKYGLAEVTSKGPKGTIIKLNGDELLTF